MVRPVAFLDLDYTLYDTDRLIHAIDVKLRAMGHESSEVQQHLNVLNDTGFSFQRLLERLGYSSAVIAAVAPEFDRMLAQGNNLLLDGVVQAVERVAKVADCVLLTYGYPLYQIEKYRHITDLHPLLTECHFVWREMTKGDVVRGYGVQRPSIFFDDSPFHLGNVKAKSPMTVCVRAMWPAFKLAVHQDDGQLWRVADSAAMFADIACDIWSGN